MKQLVIIVVIGFCIFSCNQEEFNINTFGKCNGGIITDSLSLSSKLTGTWKRTEQLCMCCGKPTKANKAVITTFMSDTTFSVSENQKIITTGIWRIRKDIDGFVISIYYSQGASDGHYLDGYITICDNQLLADASPNDGCKHLFIKTN
jgi:hypothetical protein